MMTCRVDDATCHWFVNWPNEAAIANDALPQQTSAQQSDLSGRGFEALPLPNGVIVNQMSNRDADELIDPTAQTPEANAAAIRDRQTRNEEAEAKAAAAKAAEEVDAGYETVEPLRDLKRPPVPRNAPGLRSTYSASPPELGHAQATISMSAALEQRLDGLKPFRDLPGVGQIIDRAKHALQAANDRAKDGRDPIWVANDIKPAEADVAERATMDKPPIQAVQTLQPTIQQIGINRNQADGLPDKLTYPGGGQQAVYNDLRIKVAKARASATSPAEQHLANDAYEYLKWAADSTEPKIELALADSKLKGLERLNTNRTTTPESTTIALTAFGAISISAAATYRLTRITQAVKPALQFTLGLQTTAMELVDSKTLMKLITPQHDPI